MRPTGLSRWPTWGRADYTIYGKQTDMRTDGHAAMLDEAKAAFAATWREWLRLTGGSCAADRAD
jgi:hypothetical protein